MNNFLDNLLARSSGTAGGIRPRPVARFESPEHVTAARLSPDSPLDAPPMQPTVISTRPPVVPPETQSAPESVPVFEPTMAERTGLPRLGEPLGHTAESLSQPGVAPAQRASHAAGHAPLPIERQPLAPHANAHAPLPIEVQPPPAILRAPDHSMPMTVPDTPEYHAVQPRILTPDSSTLHLPPIPLGVEQTATTRTFAATDTPDTPHGHVRTSLGSPIRPTASAVELLPVSQENVGRERIDQPVRISVTIGRIELRAATPPRPVPHARPTPKSATLSLDDYLARRDGGRR